ncbi:MAG: hypothetical protein ACPIOQ_26080, partial [Promethearchaeia archaeon]
ASHCVNGAAGTRSPGRRGECIRDDVNFAVTLERVLSAYDFMLAHKDVPAAAKRDLRFLIPRDIALLQKCYTEDGDSDDGAESEDYAEQRVRELLEDTDWKMSGAGQEVDETPQTSPHEVARAALSSRRASSSTEDGVVQNLWPDTPQPCSVGEWAKARAQDAADSMHFDKLMSAVTQMGTPRSDTAAPGTPLSPASGPGKESLLTPSSVRARAGSVTPDRLRMLRSSSGPRANEHMSKHTGRADRHIHVASRATESAGMLSRSRARAAPSGECGSVDLGHRMHAHFPHPLFAAGHQSAAVLTGLHAGTLPRACRRVAPGR